MNILSPIRVPTFALKPGDITASGETVISVSAGIRTPKNKMDVHLERGEKFRVAQWGKYTMIGIRRLGE